MGFLQQTTRYALETRLLEQEKDKLNEMLYIGLSPIKVISHYRGLIFTLAKINGLVN